MKLVIASDHAGFELKEHLKKARPDIDWVDLGPSDAKSVDYPDYADKAVIKMRELGTRAVLVCGSGQGMCMRANKYPEIRAALVWDTTTARLSREHNDANVLCIGGRLIPYGTILEIFKTWMTTDFLGGRHEARVKKISEKLK